MSSQSNTTSFNNNDSSVNGWNMRQLAIFIPFATFFLCIWIMWLRVGYPTFLIMKAIQLSEEGLRREEENRSQHDSDNDEDDRSNNSLVSVGEVDTMWREQQSAQVNEMSDKKADVRMDQVEEQETSAGIVVEDMESRHASVHVNIAQDLNETEEKLRDVEVQIERLQGRMLERQVSETLC
ncbi:hypothetical protein GUITHDRAFT_118421 [Guillardia theta CCMP2712]|uniref:Uncharacterized protein n=1 Tax=Guillardia theta (strain CCMP2712) TaxID=905079 RepID=L1IGQ3_GUITC|nr:hypothetical protein GUITHDRAFT_118421 [Guillardia theta CCMP2712]EKX35403.1 hypothetical protein GUITHDRAFT_118421 [Guillardia theta CCMP2712]|eukprot:XP_005822383.1 hypothetical protein GUITHDRAFT_118421 [Guillardia theta CCMP2712]